MTWPLAWRSEVERAYDEGVRDSDDRYRGIIGNSNALSEHNGALAQMLNAATERYDKLLDKYHALRVQGANATPELTPIVTRPPDPVTQAILSQAGSNTLLRKHFSDFVAEQRASGVPEADIAASILKGVDPTTEGLPA